MPNTKKKDDNQIDETDKTTLHDAGVDVGGESFESMTKKVIETPKEEAEPKQNQVVDVDSNVVPDNDKELAGTGITFVEEPKMANKEDLSALAEEKMRASGKDLEEEFHSELSTSKIPTKEKSEKVIIEKSSSLTGLLTKIQEKLGIKKKKVKTELGTLKQMKEVIGNDIEDIKELEESETKIKTEMEKIESIRSEVDSIEKEVEEELKN